MLLFLDAHIVQHLIVLRDAKRMEIMHHAEVLADVAALQSAREVERHEPTDDVAGTGDDLADDMETEFIVLRHRDTIQPHDGEHFVAVAPFIHLDLPDSRFISFHFR